MTTLEIRKLVAKRTDIRILLDPKPLRATIRSVTTSDMVDYVFWDDTSGEGYCSEVAKVQTSTGERALVDAEEMSTSLPMSSVQISDKHVVYADGDTLEEAHPLTFPDDGGDDGGEEEGGDEGTSEVEDDDGGDGPIEHPERSEIEFDVGTDTPSAVAGAFSEVNSAIDRRKMRLRDNYGVSSADIQVVVDTIEIELEGDKVWERGWFISDTLKDLDSLGDATSIVFQYVAESAETSGSTFEAGFEGSAAEFANHFDTSYIPEGLIGPDGDSDGEAVLTVNTRAMSDTSRENTLGVLESALEDLGGINNIELVVSGTVLEATEDVEEVSA